MKIGIIGLGDIARKAYLPVITTKNHELVLCSRTKHVVEEMAQKYRINAWCYDYKDLLKHSVNAVFIHTATSSHYEIIKFFLNHNIHVFVDKPISWYLEETMEVYELAKEKNLVLMVGFNRRYSPRVKELMNLQKPEMLIIQKNRYNHPEDVRQFIYDDFIHVIDTLLYLFRNQEKEFDYNGRIIDGKLHSIALILQGEGATAFGSMNRMSGAKEERIDYMTDNIKHIIMDLDHVTVCSDNSKKNIDFDDWTPTLIKRGFEDLIDQFLTWVDDPQASKESLEMSLRCHEVCEYLVMEYEQ
jgi:virulence factor